MSPEVPRCVHGVWGTGVCSHCERLERTLSTRPSHDWWRGWLHLDGWAGRTKQPVMVMGNTATKYRITPDGVEEVQLAGAGRKLVTGESELVPKTAVTRREVD